MLDELRQAAARQRSARSLKSLQAASRRLISEQGDMNGLPVARDLLERLDLLDERELGDYFAFLADDMSPDPQQVLKLAQDYAAKPEPRTLIALEQAVEPPRQELLRRLNRTPGGTAAILRLRRALLKLLPQRPALQGLEADLLHLLSSWFNPGFLQLKRVDWNSPARLLEKIIVHEAVHEIDGWDDLRRRLQPDRRCFAFFHPQLPDAPLIFVEVALLPEMPAEIAPLIDKASTPLEPERFRVAAFYGISNCEPGLRSVSLGNFLIKQVAEQLKRELPRLHTFCTLSPLPGFAAWLVRHADPVAALGEMPKAAAQRVAAAREALAAACGGDLKALHGRSAHGALGEAGTAALSTLAAAYVAHGAPRPDGDAVARFHLDNGARLERLNVGGNMSPNGLRQSFGMMVNYLYDLGRIEASHERFRRGEVVRSRAVGALL
jgi:malonyl-CoA decarboxylase